MDAPRRTALIVAAGAGLLGSAGCGGSGLSQQLASSGATTARTAGANGGGTLSADIAAVPFACPLVTTSDLQAIVGVSLGAPQEDAIKRAQVYRSCEWQQPDGTGYVRLGVDWIANYGGTKDKPISGLGDAAYDQGAQPQGGGQILVFQGDVGLEIDVEAGAAVGNGPRAVDMATQIARKVMPQLPPPTPSGNHAPVAAACTLISKADVQSMSGATLDDPQEDPARRGDVSRGCTWPESATSYSFVRLDVTWLDVRPGKPEQAVSGIGDAAWFDTSSALNGGGALRVDRGIVTLTVDVEVSTVSGNAGRARDVALQIARRALAAVPA